jgi:hypothetical protein
MKSVSSYFAVSAPAFAAGFTSCACAVPDPTSAMALPQE